MNAAAAKTIKAYYLRLLARREHSRKELLNKGLLKGFNKDDLQPVLDELSLQGWQDDNRYAESYARQRIQKGYGPIAVLYELSQNGVVIDNLDSLMHAEAASWMTVLEQVYRKKYAHERQLSRQEWAKRSRFLMQRGFSSAMINALFHHLSISFPKF